MELNRRNFIKFLVGGAVGIQATPLPWKLTDDIAIWTQNWPWVPDPPTGEFTQVQSVCNLCPGGCGIGIRKVGERAVKIEGRTDYPVNPGGICPVGMGGLQLLYDESLRFTSPMKRVGQRGAGEFMDITWDEAIGTLAERISNLRKKGRPEALAAIDGSQTRSTVSLLIERLLTASGSPNYVRTPSIEDTYTIGNTLMQGTDGPMAYDLENATYVLSFGCGLLEGWGAPGRVIHAWSLWHENPVKRGTKIVQIESMASNTASKADLWVAPRPGTHAALALGLAHVIIKEGLYSSKFVDQHSFGFYDWRAPDGSEHKGFKTMVLDRYAPEQVAKVTGVEPKVIVSLARAFAESKAPLAVYGKGKDTLNGSVYEFMAVQSLNALTGSINRPGGALPSRPLPLSPLPPVELDATAGKGLERPRLDQAGSPRYPFTKSLLENLSKAVAGSSESPVDALLVFSANPCFTMPDAGEFTNALKKIPFIVSFSPFRDETSHMADLILPDHTYLEKMEDVVWPVGLQYPFYGISKPVVPPLYNTKSTGDVILQLAKKIGQTVGSSFPWKNYEAVLESRAKGLYDSGGGLVRYKDSEPAWKWRPSSGGQRPQHKSFDEMWKKIKSGGFWYRPVHVYEDLSGTFKTASGKFEFFSSRIDRAVKDYAKQTSLETALNNMGIAATGDEVCMPHYEAVKDGAEPAAYPLLMLPYDMINLASGWVPSPPFLYKTIDSRLLNKNESFAAINPKTALEYKLKDGDQVTIQSQAGSVKVRLNLFEGAMPGIVYLPSGLGHTAYDEFIRGKGVNPNDIIFTGKDPLSGYPIWWSTPVKIARTV